MVISRSVITVFLYFESAKSSSFDFALLFCFGTTIFVFFVFAIILEEFGQKILLCLAEEETYLFLLTIVFQYDLTSSTKFFLGIYRFYFWKGFRYPQ